MNLFLSIKGTRLGDSRSNQDRPDGENINRDVFPERYSETMRTHLLNRRDFIAHARNGISSIALASLLCEQDLMAEGSVPIDSSDPFRPRLPQKRARARNVIVVFCAGALSHVDFWEFKPELIRYHGKPLPGNVDISTTNLQQFLFYLASLFSQIFCETIQPFFVNSKLYKIASSPFE